MTTDREKLKCINIGDVVNWLVGSEECSGPVLGFRLPPHPDQNAGHSVIVGRVGNKDTIIPLRDVVARRREKGIDGGTVSWR